MPRLWLAAAILVTALAIAVLPDQFLAPGEAAPPATPSPQIRPLRLAAYPPPAAHRAYLPLLVANWMPGLPTFTPLPTQPPTPTATATTVPTPTPTATATPCNQGIQAIQNPGFEDGFTSWLPLGLPVVSTTVAIEGSHSAFLGGYDNADDSLTQRVSVPDWAESGAVYFSWYVFSQDSLILPTDRLAVSVHNGAGTTLVDGYVWNNSARGAWYWARMQLPPMAGYRGQNLYLTIRAGTDGYLPTSWYVDKVWLTFACGSSVASTDY